MCSPAVVVQPLVYELSKQSLNLDPVDYINCFCMFACYCHVKCRPNVTKTLQMLQNANCATFRSIFAFWSTNWYQKCQAIFARAIVGIHSSFSNLPEQMWNNWNQKSWSGSHQILQSTQRQTLSGNAQVARNNLSEVVARNSRRGTLRLCKCVWQQKQRDPTQSSRKLNQLVLQWTT